jgi:hypothetical protein
MGRGEIRVIHHISSGRLDERLTDLARRMAHTEGRAESVTN